MFNNLKIVRKTFTFIRRIKKNKVLQAYIHSLLFPPTKKENEIADIFL